MDRRSWPPLVAEAIGTFLFFFVGCGSVVINDYMAQNNQPAPGLVGVALAHGIILAIMVSAFGAISGGHFNPAVTIAVWLAGKIEPMKAVGYIVVQLVAAVVAGLAVRFVFPEAAWTPSHIGVPALGPGITPGIGIVIEAILTLVLIFAVFGTAVDPRGPRLGGFAIGLAIAADILMGGPLTGGAMNPARWFGPAVASGVFDNWYVWIIGPILGAVIAALIYRFVLAEDAEMSRAAAATPAH